MGLRVTGIGSLQRRLNRAAASSRALRRLQNEAAQEIAEVAREGAPVDTGNLEGAIYAQANYDEGSRVDYIIVDESAAPYAIYMHEGQYSLGPKSQAKDGSGRIAVGPKFLSRAVQYVMGGAAGFVGYFQRAVDAVQRNLK